MSKPQTALVHLALLSAAVVVGCGGTYPVPSERMTTTQAAVRGAEEVGTANEPNAALHLKLAREQLARAKVLVRDDANMEADYALMRATAEAELAMSLSRAATARADAQVVIDQTTKMRTAPP